MVDFNRKSLFGFLVLLVSISGFAQKGIEDGSRYGHGEDSIRCIRNLSLYREYAKHDNYKDAIHAWRIVFSECPHATKNIYIDGARMFNVFIEKETDKAKQDALIDTLMMIYDQRIKYFRQEGSVRGRQGVDLLRYRRDDPEKLMQGYEYLKKSATILKNKTSIAVIATMMQAAYSLFEQDLLTDIQVLDDYAMSSDILDYMLSRDANDVNTNKVKESVDLGLIVSGAATCESIISYFKPDYEKRKNDLNFVKKVASFMSSLDCKDDPLYIKATEDHYRLEPTAESAFNLAKLFVTRENFDKAVKYYNEAITREKDESKKAEYYYQLGVVTNAKMNQPEKAREYALKALEIRPDWGEPYILIGDAYVDAKDCFTDDFEKKTIYWAAVDKFMKAKEVDPEVSDKAIERISTYSQYFPDAETVFFYGHQDGDSYKVGCWINETTTVRTK